jgi:hypothetical protein
MRKDRKAAVPYRLEIRLPAELAEQIDDWRREQPDLPSKTEAIRRLVELGLGASPRKRRGVR